MKLSHSARETYTSCSEKWRLRYQERLRGVKIASPLFFGSALDEAFSHLLLTKKAVLSASESEQLATKTAAGIFLENMTEIEHNGQTVKLAQNPLVDYFKSDFSPELLNNSHLELLRSLEPGYVSLDEFVAFKEACDAAMKTKQKLEEADQILYNYITWLSLVEKGKLMVDAYQRDILPEIEQVFDIQKAVSLPNGHGDEVVGLIDYTCSFNKEPGCVYVMDNKTSSTKYAEDSVKTSSQLSTYCEHEGTRNAGYSVIEKKLYKKEPQIHTQLILDEVSEEITEKTFDDFEKMRYNIEAGQFEKNWDSCFAFGRRCEYFLLCKHKSMDGLVKLEKK